MKKAGRFSEEAFIRFWQESNFAQGQPCGGSYISPAYKCRVGQGNDSTTAEVGASLLNGSFDEYESNYAPFRDKILQDNCNEIVGRCYGDSKDHPEPAQSVGLDKRDRTRLEGASRAVGTLKTVAGYDNLGTQAGRDAGTDILSVKEFFDDVKWKMQPDDALITPGSLKLVWDGKNLDKNFLTQMPDGTIANRASRAGVSEHPVPTKVTKSELRAMQPTRSRQVMQYALEHNFISVTSAPEDGRLASLGLKDSMPSNSNLLSRYTTAKIKTFVLDRRVHRVGSSDSPTSLLMKSAANAKAQGLSYEEWVATVVRTPGQPPAKSVFLTKPKKTK